MTKRIYSYTTTDRDSNKITKYVVECFNRRQAEQIAQKTVIESKIGEIGYYPPRLVGEHFICKDSEGHYVLESLDTTKKDSQKKAVALFTNETWESLKKAKYTCVKIHLI